MQPVFFTFANTLLTHRFPKGTLEPCWAIKCEEVVEVPDGKYWLYWNGEEFQGGIFCCDICALKMMPIAEMNKA